MKAKFSQLKKHNRFKILLIVIFTILCNSNKSFSQDTTFSKSSITAGFGLTTISGGETSNDFRPNPKKLDQSKLRGGAGLNFWVGWQKNIGASNRLRINPNILLISMLGNENNSGFFGTFKPPLYIFQFNIHYDLFTFKHFSIVGTLGAFTGFQNNKDVPFRLKYTVYTVGGNAGLGFRFYIPNSRTAIEIRPVTLQFDNQHLIYGIALFNMDFKLNKKMDSK